MWRTKHTVYTTTFDVVESLVIYVGIIEHSLRGDAADVETCATQRATLLYAGRLCDAKKKDVMKVQEDENGIPSSQVELL
jgi:hypothetical protein